MNEIEIWKIYKTHTANDRAFTETHPHSPSSLNDAAPHFQVQLLTRTSSVELARGDKITR